MTRTTRTGASAPGIIATVPLPAPPAAFERLRLRMQGRADRWRYRDRIAAHQHTHATQRLASVAGEQMRHIDLWELAERHRLDVELAVQRSIIENVPQPESAPPAPEAVGDDLRDRFARRAWLDRSRELQGRNASASARRHAASERYDELQAERAALIEIAWNARRLAEECYHERAAIYGRARYRRRFDDTSEPGMRIPGLGNRARYEGVEEEGRPGRDGSPGGMDAV